MFACAVCTAVFLRKDNLTRHVKSIHEGENYLCNICEKSFSRRYNLDQHMKNAHDTNVQLPAVLPIPATIAAVLPAAVIAQPSSTLLWDNAWDDALMEAMDDFENQGPSTSYKRPNHNSKTAKNSKKARLNLVNSPGFVEIGSSHRRKIVWYYAKNIYNCSNYPGFLNSIKSNIIELLKSLDLPIKFNLKLEAVYHKPDVESSSENRAFKTSARAIFDDTDIENVINEKCSSLLAEEDAYMGRGSGFSLRNIDGILLTVYHYTPMGGSSYIPLPSFISNKKAVINPQNADNFCFKWAILAKHVTGIHTERVGRNYIEHEEKYDFTGLAFPTPLNEVRIFEKNNRYVSVNVYGLKKQFQAPRKLPTYDVYPLKVEEEEKIDHFDILLITDGENYHYTYISNFSRLVRSQKTSHHGDVLFCKRCFTSFDNRPKKKTQLHGQAALDQHKLICGAHKAVRAVMPAEGDTLKFEEWIRTQRHPIVVYADFEALLTKCSESKGTSTEAFQKHNAMSYGFVVKTSNAVSIELKEQFDIPQAPVIFRGCETKEEVAKYFIEAIVEVTRRIEDLLKTNKTIIMSDEEKENHMAKKECDLCNIIFTQKNYKVADHCHLSGKFRQTLCNNCNMKLQLPNFVPCFLHNLSSYDAHFIVRELGYDTNAIKVIPNTMEKYISFSKYISNTFTLRFIDTYRFMASSLSNLSSNLLTSDFSKFRETSKVFKTEDMPLVTRKGVYPYEYTDSWTKLEETCLPRKEDFYSTLGECDINEEDYEHAKKVWTHFGCQTLGEYSDLYLKVDVMLLADVFENFRDICLKTYSLDPAFYYTAPGLSFDSMLKLTGIKLELLTDYDMLLMFEKGIRGGLTQASMRYAKANNYTIPDFDDTKPKSYLIYQDCNNLYGWAMSEYMPYGGFKWGEALLCGLNDLNETSPIGRMYEVDITYPKHLHEEHNDLPFLPNQSIPIESKINKLMATFEKKERYVVHYRNLQQAIKHGLIVEKVHRVLEFKQSPWLAQYIKLNTEKRKQAINDFEKDFYKLMNNAVFGKTMENVRKRIKMELVSSDTRIQKLINKPTFKNSISYKENLSAVSLDNKVITFDKPMYIGFAVLEISKTLMYDYHYNVMKKHYNNDIILMYTDTDSLVYHIQTGDFYADLLASPTLLNRMDTANLPRDHPCYIAERKKIPGLFSDETDGKTMTEFVALRAKSYAFSIEGVEKIKAKGIRGHVVKNHMTLEDHKRCLFDDKTLNRYTDNVSIRSFKHLLTTIKSHKLTYNSHDDKRHVLEDQIHTLAHGHYKIDELNAAELTAGLEPGELDWEL